MPSIINKRFIEAAPNNQLDELKNLLGQGADIHTADDYALKISAIRGHLETVKFLITQGANVHANDDEALRDSAFHGHLEIVKFLVTQGANIHADNDSALRWAAFYGHFEVVKFLVAKGANIHVNDDEIFKTAIKNENEPILILLNAFLTEDKLLVAAVGVTSASTWVGGMPLVATSDCMLQELSAVGSAPKTKRPSITKTKRSKI